MQLDLSNFCEAGEVGYKVSNYSFDGIFIDQNTYPVTAVKAINENGFDEIPIERLSIFQSLQPQWRSIVPLVSWRSTLTLLEGSRGVLSTGRETLSVQFEFYETMNYSGGRSVLVATSTIPNCYDR